MDPANPVSPTAIANQHAKATNQLNFVSVLELNESMLPIHDCRVRLERQLPYGLDLLASAEFHLTTT